MKILHISYEMAFASGVATFVRRLADTIKNFGVESETLVESRGDLLPEMIDADIVHIHGMWRPYFHRICIKASEQEVPVVWSPHGMLAPWSMKHKRLKKMMAWWIYQKWDLSRASMIHVTSEQEAQWVRNQGFKQPIVMAPLGSDLPAEKLESITVDQHLQSTPKTLLFVGRVYPVKAIDRLICAFAQAAGSVVENVGLGWKLRIVGPDQHGHMAELMRLCESLDLPYSDPEGEFHAAPSLSTSPSSRPWVEFVGPKYGADLEAEYENCDCLALVSHTENFGATVVDAMAHHKPVITSTFTPWKVVQDEKCGWWVDNSPGTLAAVFRDLMAMTDVERDAMGKRGRMLVESRYTWPAVAKTMKAAYWECCKDRASS